MPLVLVHLRVVAYLLAAPVVGDTVAAAVEPVERQVVVRAALEGTQSCLVAWVRTPKNNKMSVRLV